MNAPPSKKRDGPRKEAAPNNCNSGQSYAMPAVMQDEVLPFPQASGVEKSILSMLFQYPNDYLPHVDRCQLTEADFHIPAHFLIFRTIRELHGKGCEIELVSLTQHLLDKELLGRAGGPSALTDIHNYHAGNPTFDRFKRFAEILHDKKLRRSMIKAAENMKQAALESPDSAGLADALRQITELEKGTACTSIADTLAVRAFDFDSPPEKPAPRFRLADMPLCTPGNLMNIQAPPKAGKTAVMEAMLASAFNDNRQGADTLGFSAENSQGLALVHIDTEQSRYDHDQLVRRACRRVRVARPPEWFHSYSIADFDITERREALRYAIAEGNEEHSGIFAVMIDGVGDLCSDPNNSEEAFALVRELHTLAITHHCVIVTVLHENPGSEIGKMRGHLGSQLERKAETPLRLAKDSTGITTIWTEKARHCYLPKEQGPCFQWSDQAQMHTSCGTAGEIKSAEIREKMQREAEAAFGSSESMSYSDLVNAIQDRLEVAERTSKSRVKSWLAKGITRKDSNGNHRLINQ